jgi:hypothetical protein
MSGVHGVRPTARCGQHPEIAKSRRLLRSAAIDQQASRSRAALSPPRVHAGAVFFAGPSAA